MNLAGTTDKVLNDFKISYFQSEDTTSLPYGTVIASGTSSTDGLLHPLATPQRAAGTPSSPSQAAPVVAVNSL